jgi:hypothetical protein
MTDRGRRARWTAAAVLGPVAAAVFAGATAWTAGHPQVSSTASAIAPTPVTGPAAAAGDVQPGDVQQTLDDDVARVAALQSLVATLRAQAAALAPRAAQAGSAAGSAARAATPGLPPSATARAVPAPRTAARPPAVHAVTGAS